MKWLLSFLFSAPLDRALKSVDAYVQSETKREEMRGEVVKSHLAAQVSVLTGPGWRWMMFVMSLYAIPDAMHFAMVRFYSMFWCADCKWPAKWTVAALPEPHATYSGWIVASFFVGAGGLQVLNKWAGRK